MMTRSLRSRVHLPKRVRPSAMVSYGGDAEHDRGLIESLANRVSSLPGMECRVASPGNGGDVRRYYLDSAFMLDPAGEPSVRFATLCSAGRLSLRVPQVALDEILRSGWGEVRGGRIHTFAARDASDLTVLWRIVLMAYFHIARRRESRAWLETRPDRSHEIDATGVAPGAFF